MNPFIRLVLVVVSCCTAFAAAAGGFEREDDLIRAHLLAWRGGDVEALRATLPSREVLQGIVEGVECGLLGRMTEIEAILAEAEATPDEERQEYRKLRFKRFALQPEHARILKRYDAGSEAEGCLFHEAVTVKLSVYDAKLAWKGGKQEAVASAVIIRLGEDGPWYLWLGG